MYIGAPSGRLGLRGAAARRSATWPLALVGLGATSHTCDSLCAIALMCICAYDIHANMPLMNIKYHTLWSFIRNRLISQSSSATVFNQYTTTDDRVDRVNAAALRLQNLRTYLYKVLPTAKVLLLGEAPSPWGTRFSGIPFICERQLVEDHFSFHGKQTSLSDPDLALKKKPPYESISAMVSWNTLCPYFSKFLVWDVFPFHSHESGASFTIRTPSRKEVQDYSDIVRRLIEIVKPINTLSIGRTAHALADSIGVKSSYIRHPARGGSEQFKKGVLKYLSSCL